MWFTDFITGQRSRSDDVRPVSPDDSPGRCESDAPEDRFGGDAGPAGCSIRVLGTGCALCRRQFENAEAAVRALGLEADVRHVTDMREIAAAGVLSLPAVLVNGRVVTHGRVLTASELAKLLRVLGFGAAH
ncbi:thioredoxin family protein [Sutterella sp.]|uniref:thioredoxin family protein n=1 Tax=Sutterella sp. TaxID=1981025 RepID=UPI0026E06749|nr:thioredoxin family protein [Sutterella sp.]MDO5532203.1 thioredoxin family protein [Sutterella sp.]